MSYTIDDLDRIGKEMPMPYTMEYHDKNSLKEIKKLLSANAYNDRSTIEEHLLFLEHLTDKLQNIIRAEQNLGESAMLLRRDLEDVRKTFSVLSSYLDSID